MPVLFAAVVGYTLGAIPTAYIVVRLLTGKNVLETGSRHTSASNALRAGGRLAFALTLAGDLTKGALAMLVVRALPGDGWAEAIAGITAVLGHNASLILWLIARRFGGGVGAATLAGGAIFLWPPIALLVVPLVPILLYITGYSSVTSTIVVLTTLVTFVARSLWGLAPWSEALYALGGGLIIIYTLWPNYRRLRAGTELMIGPRARRLSKSRTAGGEQE